MKKPKCRARPPNVTLPSWQIRSDLLVQSKTELFSKSRFSVFLI